MDFIQIEKDIKMGNEDTKLLLGVGKNLNAPEKASWDMGKTFSLENIKKYSQIVTDDNCLLFFLLFTLGVGFSSWKNEK